MLIRSALRSLTFAASMAALPAFAGPYDRVQPVYDILGMPELMEIMREEGASYGDELEADMFPGRGNVKWREVVSTIYDTDRMEEDILKGLDQNLDDSAVEGILEFYDTELGSRIISLEVAARRALLDDAIEESAGEAWRSIQEEGGPRWTLLEEFVEVNDLIESNVAGALTSNLAFFQGMVDGHAFDFVLTQDEMLAEVWNQEPEIRDSTIDWVYSFAALSYQPLSEDELEAYVDFARSPEGKAMNSALFTSFNAMFAEISGDLGLGAAHFMAGEDI